jgi:hypothetical protein
MSHRPLVSPGFYLGHKYTKRFNSANMSFVFDAKILSFATRDAFTRVLRRGPFACPVAGGGTIARPRNRASGTSVNVAQRQGFICGQNCSLWRFMSTRADPN